MLEFFRQIKYIKCCIAKLNEINQTQTSVSVISLFYFEVPVYISLIAKTCINAGFIVRLQVNVNALLFSG